MQNNHPHWHQVEKNIQDESTWLKNNIFPYRPNKNPLNYSDEFFYRLIAILIVSGQIKATEYKHKYDYYKIIKLYKTNKKHGADWHNNMINYLTDLFKNFNYKVDKYEPALHYGHADLKITKGRKVCYVEIGTINIFKLYINLTLMKNINLIIITSEKIIKFTI